MEDLSHMLDGGPIHSVIDGESEAEGEIETAKPSNNPETAPGEVSDYDAWNHIPGDDTLGDFSWDQAIGLHGDA